MRGNQSFACRSRHTIEEIVCIESDNMSTGRLINKGLFALRMSPGLVLKVIVGVV